MKRERKPIEDKTLNNIFAAAFDYLRRNYKDEFSSRKALAEKMGVSKNTITNIMKCYTPVTEDAITKLQTACGCIFNLQWLRGQSDVMLAADVAPDSTGTTPPTSSTTPTTDALTAALLAAKDETIESLKRELSGKDETIAAKDALISSKDALIKTLQQQISTFQRLKQHQ